MKKLVQMLSCSLPQQTRLSQLRLSCPIHRFPLPVALFLGPHRLHLLFLSHQSRGRYVRGRLLPNVGPLQRPNPQRSHFPQVSEIYLRSVRHVPPCCCKSLPARVSVQKARNPHPRERQVTFGPPFDPRLGFLFADGPCSIKAFPRFPSWQECSTLAGDVDGYLNLLPAPQSTSPLLIGASQTEAANLEMLKDAFSGAERRTTYHRGETLVGERTFVR